MRKRKLQNDPQHSSKKISKLTEGLPLPFISADEMPDSDDDKEQKSIAAVETATVASEPPPLPRLLDSDNPVEFVENLISNSISENDARLLDGLKEIGKEKNVKKNVYEEWKKQQAKLKAEAKKRELGSKSSSTNSVQKE